MPADADLVAYLDPLVSESATASPDPTLVEGPMPELPDACVAITHYAGEPAEDRVMSPSLTAPGIEVARVQVMVRNPDKATARTRAYAYHALLDNLHSTPISGRLYFAVESIDGEPYCLGQDQNSRWRYVANYR